MIDTFFFGKEYNGGSPPTIINTIMGGLPPERISNQDYGDWGDREDR
jgi:hypothetical protein